MSKSAAPPEVGAEMAGPRIEENPKSPKAINLALQGGGAHGAFTWGVLDQLLADGRLEIEAISATSAGAINAAIVADGIMENGVTGARQALDRFWNLVGLGGTLSPLKRTPLDLVTDNWNLDNSPAYVFFDLLSRMVSPYQLNPLGLNPIRNFLDSTINFERARSCDAMRLFISATNVRTGRLKIFEHSEISADVLMASACIPFLFQAVEIDGEAYWDGGYTGNPALSPFVNVCHSADVVIVQINPLERPDVPVSAGEILERMNEITFNSTLMRELSALAFVRQLQDDGILDTTRYRSMLIHVIQAPEAMKRFHASSKMNTEWGFLTHLKELGQEAARTWLTANFDRIGHESTFDLKAVSDLTYVQ